MAGALGAVAVDAGLEGAARAHGLALVADVRGRDERWCWDRHRAAFSRDVLVEQIEILRARGLARDEAIVQAGRHRLRPILMTVLTTVFGMLPLALGLGEGSELLQPLAMVIAWGLSFSILVSLLMIPAMYRLMSRGPGD